MVFINIPSAYALLWHVYLRRFSSMFCNVLTAVSGSHK